MRLHELIVDSARAATELQRDDGSFPGGHNGPYGDPETPVRNTAHWLITLLKAFEVSGDPYFRESARAAAEYLASDSCRPMGATFLCRTNPHKDLCNGLVGQAWAIEALVAAGAHLEDESWIDLAREVFLLHPFDPGVGLWRIVNVDGSYRGYDLTFNHQLWFAACGSLIPSGRGAVTIHEVTTFLDHAASAHLRRVSRRGRIPHYVRGVSRSSDALKTIKSVGSPRLSSRARHALGVKEIAYHAFNLYGLALLRGTVPDHELWASDGLGRSMRYLETPEFVEGLDSSEFAYGYNPTGFEVAFACELLDSGPDGELERRRWWIERQLARTWNRQEKMMSAHTTDPSTLAARLYQATRLSDLSLT